MKKYTVYNYIENLNKDEDEIEEIFTTTDIDKVNEFISMNNLILNGIHVNDDYTIMFFYHLIIEITINYTEM